MNNLRSSYTKFLPIVFLGALISSVLFVYHDSVFDPHKGLNQLWYLSALIAITKFVPLWIAVGLAFSQMKPAAIALGITLLLFIADYFLIRMESWRQSPLYQEFYSIVGNVIFLPGLIFGLLCFKKQGIKYFLPLFLLAYALSLCFFGSIYLEDSPYNAWYRLLRIERLTEIRTGENSYRVLNFLTYTFGLASPCAMFILYGGCYTAAAGNKKLKDLFKIDLYNTYTKAGAITLFIILRVLINMLVTGIFVYPIAHFFKTSRIDLTGQTVFTFLVTFASGLAFLMAIVLYYRKFLVEYFIANRYKIQWEFWFVNIPIIGLLIFPFVALANRATTTGEDRTRFFFNNAFYNRKPYQIMGVLIGISLLSMLFFKSGNRDGDIIWLLWLIEVALFIWYAAAITGYYVVLGAGVLGFIFYFSLVGMQANAQKLGASVYQSHHFMDNLSLWYITAFTIVQYVILLPVFHLHHIDIVQETPSCNEGTDAVGILPSSG